MATLTWVGGGNNNASNPNDWSPTGPPKPGDTLIATDAAPINVTGNALAGDTVTMPTDYETATFNMADGSSMKLQSAFANADINICGTVSLNAIVSHGSFTTHGGSIRFIGSNQMNGSLDIESNIYGPATLHLSGGQGEGCTTRLGGDVGHRVTIDLDGFQPVVDLTIAHPTRFGGLLDFTYNGPAGFGFVELEGIHATWAKQCGETLSMFDGGRMVDQIRVAGHTDRLVLSQVAGGMMLGQAAAYAPSPQIPIYHGW